MTNNFTNRSAFCGVIVIRFVARQLYRAFYNPGPQIRGPLAPLVTRFKWKAGG
jgi:hypothetical protein